MQRTIHILALLWAVSHNPCLAKDEAAAPLSEPKLVSELDEETETLTLTKSLKQALKAATEVLKSRNQTDSTGAQLLQAYGQFLPNVQALGVLNYTKGNNYFTTATPTLVSMDSYGTNITLSTTLNLFNGLSDLAALKSASERDDWAKLSLHRAEQQIVVDITQAFLQVILDHHIVQIAEKNFEASKERQKLLREQAKVGVRNLADLFRQEAQTSADESFFITSKNKRRTDRIALLRRLRLDIEKNYALDEPPLETKPNEKYANEKELIEIALQRRDDLRAAQAMQRSASWLVTSARSGYMPKLDLGFNLYSANRVFNAQYVNGTNVTPSYQQSFFSQFGDHLNYAAGITLTWNIFDRLATNLSVQKAKVDANNAEIDAQDRKLQVVGEIRQAYGDYKAAFQQLQTASIGLTSAKKSYETVEGRYRVGAASIVDLVTAQSALVQAETTHVQALIGFALQDKLVDFFMGQIAVDYDTAS